MKDKNRVKADDMAMDGLLKQTALNNEKYSATFVNEVMSAVNKPSSAKVIYFPMLLRIAAIFAILLSATVMIIKFAGDSNVSRISENAETIDLSPTILALSPSGLIENRGEFKTIVNGMKIKSGDIIDLFRSNMAYIVYPNDAEITASAGSRIHFKKMATSGKNSDEILILERGAITADVLKTKTGRSVSVKTKHGVFSTCDAEFILIFDDQFSYLEVKHGTVYAKNPQGDVIHVKSGCSETISVEGYDESLAKNNISMHKKELSIDGVYKEMLLNSLDRKRRIDICLNSNKRRKRQAA